MTEHTAGESRTVHLDSHDWIQIWLFLCTQFLALLGLGIWMFVRLSNDDLVIGNHEKRLAHIEDHIEQNTVTLKELKETTDETARIVRSRKAVVVPPKE